MEQSPSFNIARYIYYISHVVPCLCYSFFGNVLLSIYHSFLSGIIIHLSSNLARAPYRKINASSIFIYLSLVNRRVEHRQQQRSSSVTRTEITTQQKRPPHGPHPHYRENAATGGSPNRTPDHHYK